MSAGLNFEYGFNTNTAQPIDKGTPMRVYVLGDFTGTQSAIRNSSTHSIIKIDIDNFDDVISKLSPSVELPSGELLIFKELEDFHPDNIFDHVIFKNLRHFKRELSKPATADSAAQEIISNYQLGIEPSSQASNTENENVQIDSKTDNSINEESDDMLERLLGRKKSSNAPTTLIDSISSSNKGNNNLERFLSDLLSSHIIEDTKPEHKDLMKFIDTAMAELMKSILHSHEFQNLESSWRSIRNVIFNESYDDNNQFFYLVNTNRKELNSAVDGDNNFVKNLSQHMKNTDDETYDVLIGNYEFSSTDNSIATLNYLASLAETLDCQLVTAANQSIIDADENSLWYQFRQTPQAKHVALSYPRVLLRIPYGEKQDEIDSFTFEEFDSHHQNSDLLWGNPAFSCAQLLIRQYHNQGKRQSKFDIDISELPAFAYTENDEKILQSCAEILLSEKQLINIKNHGIMAFAGYRNKNSIRLFSDSIQAVNIE
jgi:predicted component of type VI protein secretion system